MKQIIISPNELPNYVMIECPAIVKNESKAIQCFGGLNSINKVLEDTDSRRFEFRFRPEDRFCKPVCAVSKQGCGFLLRLRVRKYKNTSRAPEVLSSSPVGMFKQIFVFDSLMDFQYLPLDSAGHNVHDQLLPKSITDTEYLERPTVLFVPPLTLTRIDRPQHYCYRRPPVFRKPRPPGRNRRRLGTYTVTHLIPEVPSHPSEHLHHSQSYIEKCNLTESKNLIEQMFARRPVMSRSYLIHHSRLSSDRLRAILPLVAYYFISGPWRMMWVRLGYDPRRDPDAWQYQIVDFRSRNAVLSRNVSLRRAKASLPYRAKQRNSPAALVTCSSADRESGQKRAAHVAENMFRFSPGTIPGARQIFYQYCDIEVAEVAETLQLGVAGCYSDESGWLCGTVDGAVRTIIARHVDAAIRQTKLSADAVKQSSDNAHDDDDEGENRETGGATAAAAETGDVCEEQEEVDTRVSHDEASSAEESLIDEDLASSDYGEEE